MRTFWIALVWLVVAVVLLTASDELQLHGHKFWEHLTYALGLLAAMTAGRATKEGK